MGDLAYMTSVHGEVDGFRLVRWLRGQAEIARERQAEAYETGNDCSDVYHRARAELLEAMADDLAAELTPPDYPEDDGDGVDLDDKDTGPCEACGRLADRVPVRDNGRVFFACPGCAARASGDTVNLDDSATKGGPEAP